MHLLGLPLVENKEEEKLLFIRENGYCSRSRVCLILYMGPGIGPRLALCYPNQLNFSP